MAPSIQQMIHELSRLPGIGRKSAARLAYAILAMDDHAVENLADSLITAKHSVHPCPVCGDYTDTDPCAICANPQRRESGLLCVVQGPRDVLAMERMHEYGGVYHVLHGLISPMNGIGPEDIAIPALMHRLQGEDFREIILALNSTIEGEATASYIAELIKPLDITISRLAQGVAVGGDLEYTDELTLRMAMENRREL